jgi:hypothetical protein
VNLDLAKLGVSVACVAKTRNEHPHQDRVYACVILFVFFSRLVSILRLSSEERTPARNPVLFWCSMVSDVPPRLAFRQIQSGLDLGMDLSRTHFFLLSIQYHSPPVLRILFIPMAQDWEIDEDSWNSRPDVTVVPVSSEVVVVWLLDMVVVV